MGYHETTFSNTIYCPGVVIVARHVLEIDFDMYECVHKGCEFHGKRFRLVAPVVVIEEIDE